MPSAPNSLPLRHSVPSEKGGGNSISGKYCGSQERKLMKHPVQCLTHRLV